MLCSFCQQTIFQSGSRWGIHRKHYGNVDNDLELEQCTFCCHLRKTALLHSPYRWTIRSLPATREDQQCMVITFRQMDNDKVPDPQSGSDKRTSHSTGHFRTPVIFYLLQKDTITPATTLPRTTAITSSGSLPQIQSWIRECSTAHKRCQALQSSTSSSWLPTRLIDVSNPSQIHIITTDPSMTDRYTTLSHCWGKIEIIRLIQANHHKLTDPSVGIKWGDLTKTFQDAITVTRAVGIKYIWIDSLCIVQWDGPNAPGDFKTEGQLMHLVYRNSFLNLAGADSKDGSEGLFRSYEDKPREEVLHKPVKMKAGGAVNGEWYILPGDYWRQELLDKILYTRGWVFQERMLAPRILHFSTRQLLWDCATLSASESLPHGLPPQIDTISATERHWRERLLLMRSSSPDRPTIRAGTADDSLETFWIDSVRNYTRCELTNYISDRLQAVWGVAKVVRDGLREEGGWDENDTEQEEYASGLWSKNLYLQLAWRVVNPGRRNETRLPALQEIHPTWSWASTIGEITLQSRIPIAGTWYRVKSHDGGDLRFQVKPLDGVKGSPELAARGVEPKSDHQPELLTKRLGVRGMPVKGHWDAKARGVRLSEMDATVLKMFDFFPDVVLEEEGRELYLLVLSAHETDDNGQLVMLDDWASESKVAGREPTVTYNSGSGVILEGGVEDEYKRIGAFRFQGLRRRDMAVLVDEMRVRNIWIS
ncbi:heterokaryon incompatibility protein-domain-containing protein [Cercophora samala]|uniref:Heterokaryon incompatibility protein-domain-containing protein n=1 Tax=Cercophora samala TaxID=330535 RepID=A0AA39YZ20_9PEZI|nr:heterokaryon incompatibility protein-domain-containing protein [Cercophora samala]